MQADSKNASPTKSTTTYYVLPPRVVQNFVTKLLTLPTQPESCLESFSSHDDTVAATERLLAVQQEFRAAGKPCHVQVGYHYTEKDNVASIQQHGLMTMQERNNRQIGAVKNNGNTFGEGIYTAANPCAYHGCYGNVCIIVLRLLGRNINFDKLAEPNEYDSRTVKRHEVREMVVLSSSQQCIPIFQFDATDLDPEQPLDDVTLGLDRHHVEIQKLVDSVFCIDTSYPYLTLQVPPPTPDIFETIRYTKPAPDYFLSSTAPTTGRLLKPEEAASATCHVCHFAHPSLQFVQLHRSCSHVMHATCYTQCDPVCPLCWKAAGRTGLFGKMPSGKMVVRRDPEISCLDYPTASTIVIEYVIPSDVQELYHKNPGVPHDGIHRTAYLPHTLQGINLLKRLKYAFCHGLTFKVGVSLTSGQDNAVTWASIHHKTKTNGGLQEHGYPDPDYFASCNRELDALCVPVASSL